MDVKVLDVSAIAALALALKTGLTAYDASYLWLSKRLGADLVTLDKAQGNAAAAASR